MHSESGVEKRPPSSSPFKYVSLATTCTLIVAFGSVLYQAYLESQNLSHITAIASGLVRLEHDDAVQVLPRRLQRRGGSTIDGSAPDEVPLLPPRVAIGYGSCSDVYVDVSWFLNYTADSAGHRTDDDDAAADVPNEIHNERDLLQSFGYYFARGAAAERYTSNVTMFRALVERLTAAGRTRSDLGGNAPVMGHRFHLEGAQVLMGAQMTTELRTKLPADIRVVGPAVDYDDVHLIIEYKTGDRWGPFIAPRANRFILHNDHNNPALSALEDFGAALAAFQPRLLVISGLQMMDSHPSASSAATAAASEDLRAARLRQVSAQMSGQERSTTLTHTELASFAEVAFVRQLFDAVLPYSDSLGMNEQELGTMFAFARHANLTYASESNPRVGSTLDRMRQLFVALRLADQRRLRDAGDAGVRMTSRLHVHTLAFQAIMVDRTAGWRHTRNAAAKAALTAYRTVCRSTIVNPESATLILDESFTKGAMRWPQLDAGHEEQQRVYLNASDPVACWRERPVGGDGLPAEVEICVAPVLVCRVARQTAGAGDNISAAGLILQI